MAYTQTTASGLPAADTPDVVQAGPPESARQLNEDAQTCPVPVLGGLAGGECPVDHTGSTDTHTVGDQDSAARMFSTSVLISGIRCVLAYVVFPWILPLFGLTDWLGPWVGVTISVVAIGFNIASIRRFWRADHPWKWPITCINVSVIGLLSVLLVMDLGSIFG